MTTENSLLHESQENMHLICFGFLWVHQKENNQSSFNKNYIESLYSALEENSNFIEIFPPQNILRKWHNEGEIAIYQSSTDDKCLHINKFIRIKVVLPKRTILSMVKYANYSNPEDFYIYFNGQIFATVAKITEYPIRTEINSIAQQLLLETLSKSGDWEVFNKFDPSIIKTDLYLKSQMNSGLSGSTYKVEIIDKCACISYNDRTEPDEIVRRILSDSWYSLSSFFDQRIAAADYYKNIHKINILNNELTSLISNYFNIPKIELIFSPRSREIRKLLAEMHTMMLEISNSEEILRKTKKDAIETIERSITLSPFQLYFENQMDSEIVFNRESQLNMMNFAFSEGNTFSTTQATIVAGLASAFIASIFSLFSK